MSEKFYEFEYFFNKEGFNKALNHFTSVTSILSDFERNQNIADLLNEMVDAKQIEQNQLGVIINALLIEKFNYFYLAFNLESNIDDFSFLNSEVKKWNGIDIVIGYAHPELGYSLINPKNENHWKTINTLRKNELITIYAGMFADNGDPKTKAAAIDLTQKLLQGKKIKGSGSLLKGKYRFAAKQIIKKEPKTVKRSAVKKTVQTQKEEIKPEVKEQNSGTGQKKMTPLYSIPVTNELFHNGNVEAWKKIIESYTAKYKGLDVFIFYEGERIHDINTLFKWGKVKHGSSILFAVVGENIKDVAKLQRYLKQGASPRFEDFLRFPVNHVLNLF